MSTDMPGKASKDTLEILECDQFMCDICGLTYKHKKAFRIHIGIHSGVIPFTCNICNKIFTQKIGLQKHLLIHSGVAQYKVIWFHLF